MPLPWFFIDSMTAPELSTADEVDAVDDVVEDADDVPTVDEPDEPDADVVVVALALAVEPPACCWADDEAL